MFSNILKSIERRIKIETIYQDALRAIAMFENNSNRATEMIAQLDAYYNQYIDCDTLKFSLL